MTKSKYSTTSIVFLSIFVIYLVNGAQFLNDTIALYYKHHHCNQKN